VAAAREALDTAAAWRKVDDLRRLLPKAPPAAE
jgi:hypothetical protein